MILCDISYETLCTSSMWNVRIRPFQIIPFEDEIQYFDGVVNGETLKSTAEILPEVYCSSPCHTRDFLLQILITRELSSLNNKRAAFSTSTFIPLVQCHVVKGTVDTRRWWDGGRRILGHHTTCRKLSR